MTSPHATSALPRVDAAATVRPAWPAVLAFAPVTWPFLLKSLAGGAPAERARLTTRLGLAADALPNLGSWKADTHFLHAIVDVVERDCPAEAVELGVGATSLVTAAALARHGGGRLTGFDQHEAFVAATRRWLGEHGLAAALHHAPLVRAPAPWPGATYDPDVLAARLPGRIDLLIIDGPPWTLHPRTRGAAALLFDRLAPGATVLLDDAARPGERLIARDWARCFPRIDWRYRRAGKGLLEGRMRG